MLSGRCYLPSTVGNDQSDVVLLFAGIELANLFDDQGNQGL
jgi:hypothetical protein